MGFIERIIPAALYGLEFHFVRYRDRYLAFLGIVAILCFLTFLELRPPRSFPTQEVVVVTRGMSTRAAVDLLAQNNIVRHPKALSLLLRSAGTPVEAGAYLFNTPENMLSVMHRLQFGTFGISTVSITFPEGMTVTQMATLVNEKLPDISVDAFTEAAADDEGYLFPDTYTFLPYVDTAASTVAQMHTNFENKLAPLTDAIASSGHSLSDIITMASLVEHEAQTETDKKIVAGILWNRIAKNMPLQVDAVFGYIYNRTPFSPSYNDLTVDSPYNTYTHTGLPPGPIDNPGMVSIEAALYPTETNYLYYLTDKNGMMHYATTYNEQLANEKKYLAK